MEDNLYELKNGKKWKCHWRVNVTLIGVYKWKYLIMYVNKVRVSVRMSLEPWTSVRMSFEELTSVHTSYETCSTINIKWFFIIQVN